MFMMVYGGVWGGHVRQIISAPACWSDTWWVDFEESSKVRIEDGRFVPFQTENEILMIQNLLNVNFQWIFVGMIVSPYKK